MNKQKLLYIITQGHWGGAQKYVFDLATALADDFDITVAVGEPHNMPDLQKKIMANSKIKLVQLNFLQRSISPIKDFIALLEINNLYRKIKPDIIHLNSAKAGVLGSLATYSILQAKKSRFLRNRGSSIPTKSRSGLRSYPSTIPTKSGGTGHSKLIYTVHGWVFNEPMSKTKKFIYKVMEGVSSRRKNKIIVLSEEEKNIGVNTLRIKEQKFCVIPVGIQKTEKILDRNSAIKKLNTILKNNILTEKDYIFGTIANFYPTKNLLGLIEAFNIANPKLNNYKCLIIGDGEQRYKLEFLIKKYNLENNIFLTGFVENAEMLLNAFDVFVLPSKKEGMPYTIMEAQSHGIPIISTFVGSIPKIIDNNKTGLLIEPGNLNQLADALIYAFNNKKQMQEMAKNALGQSLPQYMKDNMIIETVNLYKLNSLPT